MKGFCNISTLQNKIHTSTIVMPSTESYTIYRQTKVQEENMASRVACIDGEKGITGHVRHTKYGLSRKPRPKETTRQNKTLVIKLKRKTLSECEVGRLSGSFSYQENIAGKETVIWCSNSEKKFQEAFFGVAERASHKSKKEFVVRIQREASEEECSTN
jgi:hypothetical protein